MYFPIHVWSNPVLCNAGVIRITAVSGNIRKGILHRVSPRECLRISEICMFLSDFVELAGAGRTCLTLSLPWEIHTFVIIPKDI